MRFNVFALAVTAALLWGGAMLVVTTAALVWPNYGRTFLEVVSSIYPGYHPGPSIKSVVTGTLYAVVDGAIGGAVLAWLYNLLSRWFPTAAA
jgi:hypothetical protein